MDRAESEGPPGRKESTKLRAPTRFFISTAIPAQSKTCHPDSQNAEYHDSNLLWPDCQFSKCHESSFAFHDDDNDDDGDDEDKYDKDFQYDGRQLVDDTMFKFTKSKAFTGYRPHLFYDLHQI